jgi:hypothetical protein
MSLKLATSCEEACLVPVPDEEITVILVNSHGNTV